MVLKIIMSLFLMIQKREVWQTSQRYIDILEDATENTALNKNYSDVVFDTLKWLYIVLIFGRVVLLAVAVKKQNVIKMFHAYETIILIVTLMMP